MDFSYHYFNLFLWYFQRILYCIYEFHSSIRFPAWNMAILKIEWLNLSTTANSPPLQNAPVLERGFPTYHKTSPLSGGWGFFKTKPYTFHPPSQTTSVPSKSKYSLLCSSFWVLWKLNLSDFLLWSYIDLQRWFFRTPLWGQVGWFLFLGFPGLRFWCTADAGSSYVQLSMMLTLLLYLKVAAYPKVVVRFL